MSNMDSHYTLDGFLQSPDAFAFNLHINSDKLLAEFLKAAPHFTDFLPLRWHRLKKIRDALVSEEKIGYFDIQLHWTMQSFAYMSDKDGNVHLSLGLLISRSSLATLGIFIHEVCHIWLSQRDDYAEIKTLQKQFRETFNNHSQCELMSPIEIFANRLTIQLLTQIEGATDNKRLKQRIGEVKKVKEQSFSHLIKQLKTLQ